MGTAVSRLMIAAGAILARAVGAAGLVLSIIFWSNWGGGFNSRARPDSNTTVIER